MGVFDREMFHDYVITLGYGPPSKKAYSVARRWFMSGEPYSQIAKEVVFRGWILAKEEV